MAKIIEKIVVDTSEHDKKLKEAKKALRDYGQEQQVMAGAVKAAAGAIGTLTAGLGLGLAAVDAFNKSIGATQTATDEFGRITESVTSVVDNFFYAITTGNFGDFINGLEGIIQRARDAYDAIDALGTFNIEKNFDISKLETKRSELRLKVRQNPNDSAAKKELDGIDKQLASVYAKEAQANEAALLAKIRECMGTGKGYEGEILKYMKIGGQEQALLDADKMKEGKLYNPYANQLEKFGKLPDKEYEELMNLFVASQSALQRGNQIKFTDNRLLSSGSGGKAGTKASPEVVTLDYEWKYGDPFEDIPKKIEKDPLKIKIVPTTEEFLEELDQLREADELKSLADNAAKAQEKFNGTVDAIGRMGSALSNIGKDMDTPFLDVTGMMAQAIATMIMGYAEAQKMAGTLGPIAWAAFGLSGLAELTSIIATVKSVGKFANGGIISGPTLGLMGEYSGAASNPEVVAPLNRLKSLIGDSAAGGGTVEFKIEGRTLVGILNKQTRANYRNQ